MPLTFNNRRRTLYIAAESTEGTFVGKTTLFVIGDAVVPSESIKPEYNVERTERTVDNPTGQEIAAIHSRASGGLSFSTRLIGPATKGTAGPLSNMLKTFLSEVLVASTSATYAYNINSTTRLSIGWGIIREDGTYEMQTAWAGCGASKFTLKADGPGKAIMCDWTFLGKQAYDTNAPVVIDDNSPQTAIVYVDDVTHGFTFRNPSARSGIFARNISKFELDFDLKGELGTDIGDPSTYDWLKAGFIVPKLKLDPALELSGSYPDLANYIAGTTGASGFTVTNAAGDTFTLSLPHVQTSKLSDGSRDHTSTWEFEGECFRSQDGVTAAAADAVSMVFA